MKVINHMICRFLGNHKYSYFTDRCVRCGKMRKSSSIKSTEKTSI